MAKKTSEGSISYGLGDNQRKVLIQRATFNMGKRREVFWIEIQNRFTSSKLPNVTLDELGLIVKLAKELRDHMESGN